MKKNQIIRLVCFCLCILLTMTALSELFHYDRPKVRERLNTFKDCEENTVDSVFIGTSGIHCFWITGQAFEENGVTVYPLTIDGMQVWHILPMLKLALKYQDIKLAVIDVRPFFVTEDDNKKGEERSRYFNEALHLFTPLRFEATDNTLKYLSSYTETSRFDLTFYFTILKYHDMWQNDLTFDVFSHPTSVSYGYYLSKNIAKSVHLKENAIAEKPAELSSFAQECLDELVAFADEKGIELLFVNTPHYMDEKDSSRNLTLEKYTEEHSIKYIDYCNDEVFYANGFDRDTDFYDQHHANYNGASKFTSRLGKYIEENCGLPDRREDEKCSEWADSYKETLKTIKDKYGLKVK